MKLATLKNGSRDGQLLVVSRDLTKAIRADSIAKTLQEALDSWEEVEPDLAQMYDRLNQTTLPDAFPFDAQKVHSPLPRAYQWADGSAYVNHVELVRKARGAEMPENFWTEPLMYQGGSDNFLAPYEAILVAEEKYGIDFEAEVGIITTDVPMGCTAEEALNKIALIVLVNDVSLRNLIPAELSKGFGFFVSKPSTAFSPIALTPNELEESWDGHRVHLPLITHLNGKLFGKPHAGKDMTFDFPQLIEHAASTRPLSAGSIIGSGTVSNIDRSLGSSCIAEKRMLEILDKGEALTPFMRFGDKVRIEMFNKKNESLFGAIHQEVKPYKKGT